VSLEEIGLWEPYGYKPGNKVYLLAVQRYLYDVSVLVKGKEATGTCEEWAKRWRINDHSNEWPRQLDGSSCGLFILLGMYCLAHRKELSPSTFSQQDIYDQNVRMRVAIILWSYRSISEKASVAPTGIPHGAPSLAVGSSAPVIKAPAPSTSTLEPIPSDLPAAARNMGGRPLGSTKKNAVDWKKAEMEATNYVVIEYDIAQKEAKKQGNQRAPKGTRDNLIKVAKELFDVKDDFDVPSSTIDSRIKAGNLEVFHPGENPIVLPLEPIFVTFILKSAIAGNPVRVGEALALCNEILMSSATFKAKVIAWKKDRGIYDPAGWLLGYDWFRRFRLRNEGIITATVGKKFAKNRADHCCYPPFEKMYRVWEDALVTSGNAIRLETPVHMDMEGNVVHEEAALGWMVTHKIIRPENVLVLDETGANTNGKSDCRNGGEKVMAPYGEVVLTSLAQLTHTTQLPLLLI
jgi:hypothetical protein